MPVATATPAPPMSTWALACGRSIVTFPPEAIVPEANCRPLGSITFTVVVLLVPNHSSACLAPGRVLTKIFFGRHRQVPFGCCKEATQG